MTARWWIKIPYFVPMVTRVPFVVGPPKSCVLFIMRVVYIIIIEGHIWGGGGV